MRAVWKILGLVGRYRWLVPFMIGLEVMAALAESFSLGLLIPFAGAVYDDRSLGQLEGPLLGALGRFELLFGAENRGLMLGISIAALILLKTVLWIAYMAATHWIKERTVHEMRCTTLRHLCLTDYPRFTAQTAGEYYNILSNESWRVAEAISAAFHFVGRVIVVLFFTAFLILLSWKLFFFSLAVFVLASLLVQSTNGATRRFSEKGVSAFGDLTNRMLSVLSGMRTVRAFGQEEREWTTFAHSSNEGRRAYLGMHVLAATTGPVLEAIYIPAFVVMVFISHNAGLPLAQIIAFLVVTYRLVPHARGLEEARISLAGCAASVKACLGLLERVTAPEERSFGTRAPVFRAGLRFERVSFSYGGAHREDYAVRDISFDIPHGRTIALVGGSGSGKSTLVNLLLGFYAPSDGRITVDGTPLPEIDLRAWRRLIGFAGQDSQLFPGTIAENIAYGRPDAPIEEIEDAARRADVSEFIDRLPHGLYTYIEPEGRDFSGGQRQRIALARALLVKPQLLILDEATNALDNVTEAAIQRMLAEVSHHTTTLIVAHRLSTIRHADWIVALDKGRIAEQGTPSDLLRNNAAFARLYKLEAEVQFTAKAVSE